MFRERIPGKAPDPSPLSGQNANGAGTPESRQNSQGFWPSAPPLHRLMPKAEHSNAHMDLM
jgi:hypothetical protein